MDHSTQRQKVEYGDHTASRVCSAHPHPDATHRALSPDARLDDLELAEIDTFWGSGCLQLHVV